MFVNNVSPPQFPLTRRNSSGTNKYQTSNMHGLLENFIFQSFPYFPSNKPVKSIWKKWLVVKLRYSSELCIKLMADVSDKEFHSFSPLEKMNPIPIDLSRRLHIFLIFGIVPKGGHYVSKVSPLPLSIGTFHLIYWFNYWLNESRNLG